MKENVVSINQEPEKMKLVGETYPVSIAKSYRFSVLQKLYDFLVDREEQIQEFSGMWNQLAIDELGNLLFTEDPKANCDPENPNGKEGVFHRILGKLTVHSINPMLQDLKVSRRMFFRLENPFVCRYLVNHVIGYFGPKMKNGFSVRVCPQENIVVGVTSEQYPYYKNWEFIDDMKAALSQLGENGNLQEELSFESGTVQNFAMHVNLLSQYRRFDVGKDRQFQVGLRLINSADRSTAIHVIPFVFRHRDVEKAESKKNQSVGAVVKDLSASVRLIHRGRDFGVRLAEKLQISSDVFDELVERMKSLGAVRNVDEKTWNRLVKYAVKRVGDSKRTREIFKAAEGNKDEEGNTRPFFFIADKEDPSILFKNSDGCLVGGYNETNQSREKILEDAGLLNIPEPMTVWATIDCRHAYKVTDESEERFPMTEESQKAISTFENELRPRDPYKVFNMLLDEAEDSKTHDRRLDYELAAGDILEQFSKA